MRTLFLVFLLTARLWAEPFTSESYGFSADFPEKAEDRIGRPNVRTFLSGPKEKFLVLVLSGPERRSADDSVKLLQKISKSFPKNPDLTRIPGGLDVEGIQAAGDPFCARILVTPQHTYIAMCEGFDLGMCRKFTQSLKVLTKAPEEK